MPANWSFHNRDKIIAPWKIAGGQSISGLQLFWIGAIARQDPKATPISHIERGLRWGARAEPARRKFFVLALPNCLLLLSQPVDAQMYNVAGFQENLVGFLAFTYTGRRAGGDDVARQKRQKSADIGYDLRTPKIMVLVDCRPACACRSRPATCSTICGSGISSLVTSQGPTGPNVSQPLPLSHCEPSSF